MGRIISAHCSACGLSAEDVVIGGGMTDFDRSFWPVHCADCKRLSSTNIAKDELTCESCGSGAVEIYGVEAKRRGGFVSVVDWGDYCLPDTDYLCPRCGKLALRFNSDFGTLFD